MASPAHAHKIHRDFRLPVSLLRLAGKRHVVWATIAAVMVFVRVALLPVLPVPSAWVHDEFSYLLASDTYAHGRMTNPALPSPESFSSPHILVEPFYASKYPPGQGMVLAFGQKLLGHPYWGVVLSTALMVFLFGWATDAWLPPQWALIATGLAAMFFSLRHYWFTSYWGGSVAACGGALVVGSLGYALRGRWNYSWWSLAGGAAILVFTRPYEGAVLVLAAMCVLGATRRCEVWKWTLLPNAAIILSLVLPAALWVNAVETGDLLNFPYKMHLQKLESAPPFWMGAVWPTPVYPNSNTAALWESVHKTHVRRLQMPVLWALGFQVFMLVMSGIWTHFRTFGLLLFAVPWVAMRGRKKSLIFLLAAGTVALIPELAIYPHYAAPFTAIEIILIAAGARTVWYRVSTIRARGPLFCIGLAILMTPMAIDYVTELQAKPDARSVFLSKLEAAGGNHLVFVDYAKGWNFDSEWVYNSAELASQRVIFAHLLAEDRNHNVVNHFPGRTVWKLKLGPRDSDMELLRVQ
jgi:hypothetical protein